MMPPLSVSNFVWLCIVCTQKQLLNQMSTRFLEMWGRQLSAGMEAPGCHQGPRSLHLSIWLLF